MANQDIRNETSSLQEEFNPYSPPVMEDLKPGRELGVQNWFVSIVISAVVTMSFLAVGYVAVQLAMRFYLGLAIVVGCIALMHIPLVDRKAKWKSRFISSCTIPFAVAGAVGLLAGFYMLIFRLGLNPKSMGRGVFFLLTIGSLGFGATLGGKLGYRVSAYWINRLIG